MKKNRKNIGVLFLLMAGFQPLFAQQADMLIKNGKIIDGTGNSWYRADLAIKEGKIIKIGRLSDWHAEKTIEANGLIIAPGFIDVHTHI